LGDSTNPIVFVIAQDDEIARLTEQVSYWRKQASISRTTETKEKERKQKVSVVVEFFSIL